MLHSSFMRVTAISDVHGAVGDLDAVAKDCDALLVLGDLINILDYRSMDGILVEVFGRESVAEAARLRKVGSRKRGRPSARELETARSRGRSFWSWPGATTSGCSRLSQITRTSPSGTWTSQIY